MPQVPLRLPQKNIREPGNQPGPSCQRGDIQARCCRHFRAEKHRNGQGKRVAMVRELGVSKVLSDEKKQQVIALGKLGWTLRRIEESTGVRRETSSNYLKAAGNF